MAGTVLSRMVISAKTFMRTWGNPEESYAARIQDVRSYRYQRLWDLYQGTAFADTAAWSKYKETFQLYRQTRTIWDHVHQLVEFYATHIWSGSLADDGLHLPNGVPNAVPLAQDTEPKLANAIGQLWLWWNFQEVMTMIVRYTAALGELLVELKDDTASGKVLINLVWPSYVRDVKLDESGNLKYYCVEYRVADPETRQLFTYRREVDGDSFRTYKNDQPFDYTKNPLPVGTEPYGEAYRAQDPLFGDDMVGSKGDVIPNPYGFVPAVWFRHYRMMGVRGEPAVWATQAELDEINQLFSHMLDKAHVSLEAPIVVSGNIAPNSLGRALNNMYGAVKRTFTDDLDNPRGDAESLNILEGPAGTDVKTIELKISEATQALDRIIAGIERKCPEITLYQLLRSMTQITGPGASRVVGDVDRKVRSIAASYDRRLINLQQMGVAIAGFRFHEGADGWQEPTDDQKKFEPFDLDSFKKGDLNHNIMPRDLVPMTESDRLALLIQKKSAITIIPNTQLAIEAGYDESVVQKWQDDYDQQQQQKFAQQQQLAQSSPFGARKPGAPADGPQRGQPNQNNANRGNQDTPKSAQSSSATQQRGALKAVK